MYIPKDFYSSFTDIKSSSEVSMLFAANLDPLDLFFAKYVLYKSVNI